MSESRRRRAMCWFLMFAGGVVCGVGLSRGNLAMVFGGNVLADFGLFLLPQTDTLEDQEGEAR